jgi:glucuronate isomerase
MAFLDDDFLLHSEPARRLYHDHAAGLPIIDYHCHLPPEDLASNRQFANLFEIWLEGDHYKWRAMRAAGVDERFCTGDATPEEKCAAWAATVPATLRNPLYHWTHLELRRYFGITDTLNASTAESVWRRANERLADPELSAQGILKTFRVEVVCTTDDPADALKHHAALAKADLPTRVYPTFRPDRALDLHNPSIFNPWLDRLSATADVDIVRLADLLTALDRRHQAFHDLGGRLSDHGLPYAYGDACDEATAAAIFDKARSGRAMSLDEQHRYRSFMMLFFGRLDAARGWTKQLHLGAIRSVNSRALRSVGRDTGYDSIGDWAQAEALAAYLDRLDEAGVLPRTILYNVNPVDNHVLATMIGNFQDGRTAGKIQFGSAWWFLDQKQGMEAQMDALSNVGLLSKFVGMVTDSRSFMSYPRHEYFRRVLCNLVGQDVARGELPDDDGLLGPLIENVCYGNARRYFGWS